MIIAPLDDRLRVITQNDHAHFASELLSLWIRDDLPQHPRRRELLFAARQHDNGWQETDSAPHCNRENRRPHDFQSLPHPERQRLWNRGLRRFAGVEPYASALIVRHALTLHRSRRDDPDWQQTLEGWETLEEQQLDESGVPIRELERDYPLIELSDLLSLAVCSRWEDEFQRHGYRFRVGVDGLSVEPFPLAGTTTFRIPCRFIEDRDYAGDSDLAIALASAPWLEATVKVRPF